MSVFKCKMCGGTLEIGADQTTAVCEYCGTQQTLPRLDDERRAQMYDRANHFRRNNDFDKAMGIYERILNEDSTDAEAYWSIVLCRYGIEYVEDPSTHKRVPTVNRTQFTSIFEDEDYKSAIEHADSYQKAIYEEEANTINEIQKGILAISQKEEPFDVFICYKETDNNGRRTQDSVLANDLYHQLTQEGFKVFFSRITLEDKLGTAYEPYIFAALNSAKVMVVIGTKPEYFNAVWVKNEWSRYLALIKNGAKRVLIPAYRDMDPYDLPEEFSHLQAQDMGKLGFMQDLIRGIKKLTESNEPKSAVKETIVVNGGGADLAPLLKRVFMFLEDGEWSSANEYCEKVLDNDPENAQAYLGKLMAELKVHRREELKEQENPFDGNNNYAKAVRFGEQALVSELQGYIDSINERNRLAKLEAAYKKAVTKMQQAESEADESTYRAATGLFDRVLGYKDADKLAQECREKAEAARKDKIYANAAKKQSQDTVDSVKKAIEIFASIKDWKDADARVQACQARIPELEQEQKEKEKQLREAKEKASIELKKQRKILAVAVIVIAIALAILAFAADYYSKLDTYNDAMELYGQEKYSSAAEKFDQLGDFRNAQTMAADSRTALENQQKEAERLQKEQEEEEYQKMLQNLGTCEDYANAMQIIQDHCTEAGEDYEQDPYYSYAYARTLEGTDELVTQLRLYETSGILDSADRAAALEVELDAKVELFMEHLYDNSTSFDTLGNELDALNGYDRFEYNYYRHLLYIYEDMSNTHYDMYQYFCSDSDHAVIYEFGSSWWISGWGDTIGIATGYGEYDEMYSRFQKLAQKAGCTIVNVSAAECEWAQKKR